MCIVLVWRLLSAGELQNISFCFLLCNPQAFTYHRLSFRKSVNELAVSEKLSRIFLNYMNLQIVKFHRFYKIVLCEAGFFMTLKIRYIFVKPDRFAQIKLTADFVQGVKYLVGSGIGAFISNTGVLKHAIILENFCPKPKHILPCLSIDSQITVQISFMVIDLAEESKDFLY